MLCAMDNDGKEQWMSWSGGIWFCDTCNLILDDDSKWFNGDKNLQNELKTLFF